MDITDKNQLKKDRLIKGQRAAKYSTLTNLCLSIIKGFFGLMSGSVALIADSIHSFSDIFASLAVYIGLKLSQKKPDEKFPYGYYKTETMASLIVAVIILFGGLEIALQSLNGIFDPQPLKLPLIAILVAVVSVAASLLLTRYEHKIGNEIKSPALMSDAKHSLIDVFSSLLVFTGVLTSYMGYLIFQGVAGLMVALLILWMGWKIGKDAVLVLMDASIDPKLIQQIKGVALAVEGVEGVNGVKVRSSGPYLFGELHLETKKNLSVEKAHEISDKVDEMVRKDVEKLETLLVQVEPVKKDFIRFALPLENKDGLNSVPSSHFGKVPYFLIWEVHDGEIKNYQIKDNPAHYLEKKKGIKTAEFLVKEKVNVLLGEELGEGPRYVLSGEIIHCIRPEGSTTKEIMVNTKNIVL
ncbi:cation diffusion facilitator family transporter [Methanobacterium formicicum]|uniref:Cation diffusion facilitator family transporter n=1 Tax=Methanobacterium formicicum (strain DSM 3637 / PP1) TaxID=1204725 RepID=K2QBQ9_METFP|nr:cation diffusion facilitator family transporter [Methanobacterium formicicum]EKF85356.1 cation diffusion facilitator family transporter [Methanobacterium formicicum DSM 3637]